MNKLIALTMIASLLVLPACQPVVGSNADAERQIAEYDRQMQKAAEQQTRMETQLRKAEEHQKRMEALVVRWEKQADRYDAILSRWEKQSAAK